MYWEGATQITSSLSYNAHAGIWKTLWKFNIRREKVSHRVGGEERKINSCAKWSSNEICKEHKVRASCTEHNNSPSLEGGLVLGGEGWASVGRNVERGPPGSVSKRMNLQPLASAPGTCPGSLTACLPPHPKPLSSQPNGILCNSALESVPGATNRRESS